MAQGGESGEPDVRTLIRCIGKKAAAHAAAFFVFDQPDYAAAGSCSGTVVES